MSVSDTLREQLLDIIAKEGMIDRAKLASGATMETIGMASYDMVMVLMAIEEKFGVYISVDQELSDVKTLDGLLDLLAARIDDQKNNPAPPPSARGFGMATDTATTAATTISTPAAAANVEPKAGEAASSAPAGTSKAEAR